MHCRWQGLWAITACQFMQQKCSVEITSVDGLLCNPFAVWLPGLAEYCAMSPTSAFARAVASAIVGL